MLMKRSTFIGPLQGIRFDSKFINRVASTRCLGVDVEKDLKCSKHVSELTKSFTQKTQYFKIILFPPRQRSVGLLLQSNITVYNVWSYSRGLLQQNVVQRTCHVSCDASMTTEKP